VRDPGYQKERGVHQRREGGVQRRERYILGGPKEEKKALHFSGGNANRTRITMGRKEHSFSRKFLAQEGGKKKEKAEADRKWPKKKESFHLSRRRPSPPRREGEEEKRKVCKKEEEKIGESLDSFSFA